MSDITPGHKGEITEDNLYEEAEYIWGLDVEMIDLYDSDSIKPEDTYKWRESLSDARKRAEKYLEQRK